MRTSLLAVFLLGGCGSPFSPGDTNEWAAARSLWAKRPFPDYLFEIRISCFCATEVNQWTRVVVTGGRVVQAQAPGATEPYPTEMLSYWPTVDEVFARVLSARHSQGVSRIDVRYDATLGYPTDVDISYDSSIQDAGASYTLRNVQFLRNPSPF
ncbi:MAG: DUF6174 domain-containing protein [Gemmatimonadota bacterium]|nr:DUF6174 domain-containing protein [Gemmatimonadota bacterium]